MKVISVVMCLAHLYLFINFVCGYVIKESECPPAEDIEPCTCYYRKSLECENVTDVEILKRVFQNPNGYTYRQINISSSSLEYLPHDMFEDTGIKNLILHRVTLSQIFDSPPERTDTVSSLHIENTEHSGLMPWDLFEPFTKLRYLKVYFNSIRVLDSRFTHSVTKNLQELTFYGTETRRIKPGVLVDYVNLNKLTMESCQLTALTRDVFPRPFNVQCLNFDYNRITTLPEDLFDDMPNLQTLSLKNNMISVIPQASFDGHISRITAVWFDGNPLKCDCSLQWVIRDKPEELGGQCVAPKRLHGKNLKDMEISDFNC